jgi:hypothetical protein
VIGRLLPTPIRARAQVPRKELEAIVKGAIEVMAPANP